MIQDDYRFLLTKYEQVAERGRDYYRDFLLPLFFCGFAKRDGHSLKQAFVKEYGPVKYLNGGLFYQHQIETKYRPSPVSENIKKGYDISQRLHLVPRQPTDAGRHGHQS